MRIYSVVLLATILHGAGPGQARELRVCADPNNLPFSDARGQGFENRIIDLIAADMGATVSYTWWAQRRGFARNTLGAGVCELWPGVATGLGMMATTHPYYRSTYVFVSRADRNLNIESFDDPRLRNLTIGVQMIGNDATNTPPAHALARRGLVENVRGFTVYGDYREPHPASSIIDAVSNGDIDLAAVWGPLAGYFASREPRSLTITEVHPGSEGQSAPMQFDISMGVRKGNEKLRTEIDNELAKNRSQIDAILAEFHVPVVSATLMP